MKAITIKPPWAQLILWGGKNIENRDWPLRYRGIIAIHSSKAIDMLEYDAALAHIKTHRINTELPPLAQLKAQAGMILGTVGIVDCVRRSSSPWFVGDYGYVLTNPRPLARPVSCRGALGLWDVPPLTLRLIEEQVVA